MKKNKLQIILIVLSICLYLITHLWNIENFPVYFFCDEAIQGTLANQMLTNNFKDSFGNFLPPIFKNYFNYNLGLSVYLNIPGVLLFGEKIWTVRLTTILVTVLGSIFISLILKTIFQLKNYWVGVLFISQIPLFFLHSRTGFETVMATSFYAGFIYFYLRYQMNKKYITLIASIIFAAMSFHSYAGIWVTVVLSLFAFFIIDLKSHIHTWKKTTVGVICTILIFLPFIFFQFKNPDMVNNHLKHYNSYLVQNISSTKKVETFINNYLKIFDYKFLFIFDQTYLTRHYLKNYGYFPVWSLPIILIGIMYLLITSIRKSSSRILLSIFLFAPIGGVIIEPGASRILPLVVPVSLSFGIGILLIEKSIEKCINNKFIFKIFSIGLFLILSASNGALAYDAVQNGPLWFTDYGLYGMQYGAKQIFQDLIPVYLNKNNDIKIYVSSVWANGADIFPVFFLTKKQQERVQIGSAEYILTGKQTLAHTFVIVTFDEYKKIISSSKFKSITIDKIIYFPDNTPGFYVLTLQYADDINETIRKENEEMLKPSEKVLNMYGQQVTITYSKLDIGQIENIFDKKTDTLVRGISINPFSIEMTFSQPIAIKSISVDLGSMDFNIYAQIFQNGNTIPIIKSKDFTKMPNDPHGEFDFEEIKDVSKVSIDIKNLLAGKDTQIHIKELSINHN